MGCSANQLFETMESWDSSGDIETTKLWMSNDPHMQTQTGCHRVQRMPHKSAREPEESMDSRGARGGETEAVARRGQAHARYIK